MQWSLDEIDELSDVVEVHAGSKASHVSRLDLECRSFLDGGRLRQASAKRLVDDVAKGAAGTAGQPLQLGRDIIIQGECRSHILML